MDNDIVTGLIPGFMEGFSLACSLGTMYVLLDVFTVRMCISQCAQDADVTLKGSCTERNS